MLPKAYDPKACEDRIYAMWEKSGAFKPESCPHDGEPFAISMPPPNATGQLHLGHAVMLALEDIFIRYARMNGKRALWIPGTDHAAIATENMVIRQLKAQGMKDPRKELGREKLIARIAAFVEESKTTIRSQIRKMGSSCDWSRERYTFEPALHRCVNEVFTKMYADGLIYRGHRIVNWDPKLQTTVSDDEVVYKEEKAVFFTFRYGPFEISTARPETKFGDKYVVMHPDDARYKKYKHGDTFEAAWINGPVRATVIKDASVDPAFGTGVMTITPWHDRIDFEIAERHGLEKEQIIGFDGRLLKIADAFEGMKIEEARPLIVEKLKQKGLLVKVDEHYMHNKAISQRGGGAIEPQIKLQWFMDVNKEVVEWEGAGEDTGKGRKGKEGGKGGKVRMSLKQIMHSVVHHGDIAIIPDRFEKTYFYWIDHLRDWCISRQIWWGHRVPVWYCVGDDHCTLQCKEPIVSASLQPVCPHCGSKNLQQDPDTLDTWFSSALWTWSTLVDSAKAQDMNLSLEEILKQSPDFQDFHPTAVMETGYDILFFWVARMILMTTYATGQIPFKTVYLHGLIRTRDGKKMSKSHPETMIDPLDIIPKYGADALRLSMIVGQSPGADSRLYEEKIAGYRNFVNKLWNASRFVLMQCEEAKIDPQTITKLPKIADLSLADRAILSRLQTITKQSTEGLAGYRLSEVGDVLYSFVWDDFCDWYLEFSKGNANIAVLVHTLRSMLLLLHPYCPFVTEELWATVKPEGAGLLIQHPWPRVVGSLQDAEAERAFHVLINVISSIRTLRADQSIEPQKKVTVTVVSRAHHDFLEEQRPVIERMARLEKLTIASERGRLENTASALQADMDVYLHLEGLLDSAKERVSLEKEKEAALHFLASVDLKLDNADFARRAPEQVIAREREKQKSTQEKLQKIEERLRFMIQNS